MPTRVAARKIVGGSVDIIRSGLVGFWDCLADPANPGQLRDLSGNGWHAQFGTDAGDDTQDPQLNAYGVTFGGDDFAQCTTAFSGAQLTGDFTLSAVWKAPTAAVSGTVFGFGKVGANEYMVLQENRSTIGALARSAHTSDTTATPTSVPCALGSVVAATFKKSGTTFILTNDLTGASSSDTKANVDLFTGPHVFVFGRLLRASISSYYSYDLYAAAAYNRCLSSDEHVLRNRLFFQALIRPRGLIIGASAP
jgi:hypothetical protein